MKKSLLSSARYCFAIVLAAMPLSAASADTYTIVSTTTTEPANHILRTEYRVQVGSNTLNQFSVTRIRRDIADDKFRGPVMLMAPLNFDVRFYEIRQSGNYKSSWAGGLANDKFDVWVVDDRINRGTVTDCQNNVVDCSIMATWTAAARIADSEYALGLIAAHHPGVKPVIGGAVGGATAATNSINAYPSHYSGLVAIQGALYSADPAVKAYNQNFCNFANFLVSQGVIYDGSADLLFVMTNLAYSAPSAVADPAFVAAIEAALPGYDIPSGITNHELLVHFFSHHNDNPNFPTPTWITAIGDYQQGANGKFFEMDEDQYRQMGTQLNHIAAIGQFRDYVCALAGAETTLYNNLGAFQGRVFLLGSQLAFGPELLDEAPLFTSAENVQVDSIAGWGELDLVLNKHRQSKIDNPVSHWLKNTFEILRLRGI